MIRRPSLSLLYKGRKCFDNTQLDELSCHTDCSQLLANSCLTYWQPCTPMQRHHLLLPPGRLKHASLVQSPSCSSICAKPEQVASAPDEVSSLAAQ